MIIVQKITDSNPGRPKLKRLQGFIRIYAKANAFETRTSNFKRSIQKSLYQNQTTNRLWINTRDTLRLLKTVTIHYGILTSPYCIALILTWRNRKEGDLRQRQKVQEDQQGGNPAACKSGFLIWQLRHQNRGMFQHLCTLLWHKYR